MTADAAQVVTAKDAAAYAALCAEERGSVRFGSSCSEKQQSLLVECCRLVDPAKLRKLLAWLRADREAGDVSLDFIVMFCHFWHEAIVAGLDTEALLDFALNWHLAASGRGTRNPPPAAIGSPSERLRSLVCSIRRYRTRTARGKESEND
jgi:hypothetical protein